MLVDLIYPQYLVFKELFLLEKPLDLSKLSKTQLARLSFLSP